MIFEILFVTIVNIDLLDSMWEGILWNLKDFILDVSYSIFLHLFELFLDHIVKWDVLKRNLIVWNEMDGVELKRFESLLSFWEKLNPCETFGLFDTLL